MDRAFSFEDPFWSSSSSSSAAAEDDETTGPTMNRSAPEWAFQRFITEEVDKKREDKEEGQTKGDLEKNGATSFLNVCLEINKNSNVPVDLDEYQAVLKNKLNLACAAVAMSRASFVKPQDSAARADSGSQASNTLQTGSKATSKGLKSSVRNQNFLHEAVLRTVFFVAVFIIFVFTVYIGTSDKDLNAPVGFPSSLKGQKKSGVQVRSSTIGSSSELSDEDELEGENETMENMDPADAKRVRRMLSNRELTRRSRRRKHAHLTELETQVAQLRVENAALLKRLSDISQKYNNAAVDNRVLKADVETLKAKVKMAEGSVKRFTGLSYASAEISTMRMSSFDGSPTDTSADAAVPVQDGSKHPIYQAAANKAISTHDLRTNNALSDISSVENIQPSLGGSAVPEKKIRQTNSLQRVASLEHLQKRICGRVSPCRLQFNGEKK
ncbi:light-inducible protein CPRF2-like isoform X1 [Hibiscus syriacus]|uniref:light-inducible protein CPRF2-like isoform X1 n=1 Tax=Hibiscus syriacus TaxID=106335 RepID=UPI00192345D8|nr:light-inducible protein CPRF2-like isoform X1 [Hibiscus syriacus]